MKPFLFFWVFFLYYSVHANSLADITFPIQDQFDKIHLQFHQAIESEPVITVSEGAINIYLASSSQSPKPSKTYKPIQEHLVHSAVVIQNKNSIRIDIALKSLWNVQDQIQLERDATSLFLAINRNALIESLQSKKGNSQLQEDEVRQRIQQDYLLTVPASSNKPSNNNFYTNSLTNSEDWLPFSITVSLTLLAFLLFLYIILYLYQKLSSGKIGSSGSLKIQVAATYHLGAKQKVVILQIEDRFFACGVTLQSINFLTEVGGAKDQAFLNDLSLTNGIQLEARSEFEQVLKAAQAPHQESPSKELPKQNVPTTEAPLTEESLVVKAPQKEAATPFSHDPAMNQFAKVLNQKIQKLKPLGST